MVAWLRVLANPKMLKHVGAVVANPRIMSRFIKTPAGRRAAFKYGSMLSNSRSVQNGINKFISRNDSKMQSNQNYAEHINQYHELQKRIVALESELEASRASESELQTATFTLGRRVIEMQRLYADMQRQLHELQQIQIARTVNGHIR